MHLDLFVVFWSFMILTSVFWYGFLIFYVGVKAGKEIKEMIHTLTQRPPDARP